MGVVLHLQGVVAVLPGVEECTVVEVEECIVGGRGECSSGAV